MTEILREPFNNLTAWTVVGAPGAIIEAGRTGTGVRLDLAGTNLTRSLVGAEQSADLTFGFAFKLVSLAALRPILALRSATAGTLNNEVQVLTDGTLRFVLSAPLTALVATAPGAITTGVWRYVEVQVKLHDTLGTATMRLDNTTVGTFGPGDTKAAGPASVYDTFRLTGQTDNTDVSYDDLYLKYGAGETFLGDIHIGGANMKAYNGAAFVDCPVKVYNGSAFVDATAVKTWNGSAFV